MLVDHEIRDALASGEGFFIHGLRENSIGPCSVDFDLSCHFVVFEDGGIGDIDPKKDNSLEGRSVLAREDDYFLLQPRQFVLASTQQRVTLPNNIAGQLEGKSSLARLGLIVHVTAGFFDVGFSGYPTLELYNLRGRPIRLYPGMPIAQMTFTRTEPAVAPYGWNPLAKYQSQGAAPAQSLYHRNFPRSTTDG